MAESGQRRVPKHDLGVLFVHGIGQQRQGDTLARWGDAVITWMRRWFGEHHDVLAGDDAEKASDRFAEDCERWREAWNAQGEGSRVVIDRITALRAAAREEWLSSNPYDPRPVLGKGYARYASTLGADLRPEPGSPPHAHVRVGVLCRGTAEERSWLLAESHWADQFTASSFREMVAWSFLGVPFALGNHFGTSLRRDLQGPGAIGISWMLQLVRHAALHLACLLVAPLVVALLAATLVLALIPLGALRAPFRGVQLVVSRFLGDCHALVERPTSSAAIQARVSRDLQWLAGRCRRVAIVAHSQGAAVTYLALRNGSPPELERVVTLGSGLRKLHELETLRESSVTRWLAAAVPLAGAFSILAVLHGLSGSPDPLVALLGAGLLLLVFTAFLLSSARPGMLAEWFSVLERRGVTWREYYSSRDPVSNGPLFDPDESAGSDTVTSIRVDNSGSVLLDHVTYWGNADEFVSRVVRELCGVPGASPTALLDDERLDLANVSRRRRARTGLRSLLTWSLAGGVLAEVASRPSAWVELARRLADRALFTLPRTGWSGLGAESLPGKEAGSVAFPAELLEATLDALWTYVGCFALARIGWWAWNRSQVAAFFRGKRDDMSWLPLALLVLPAAVLLPTGVGHWLERRVPSFEPAWVVSLVLFVPWFVAAAIAAGHGREPATASPPSEGDA